MRTRYDMSHYSFQTLGIGHMQTLSCMPVLPGDSWEALIYSQVKLAALRQPLSIDAEVMVFGAYTKLRWTYSNIENMIEEGVDSTQVLTDKDIGSGTGQVYPYLCGRFTEGNSYQKARIETYLRNWDWFARHKTLTPTLDGQYDWVPVDSTRPTNHTASNSPIVASVFQQKYGMPMARLATPWARGIVSSIDSSDTDVSSASSFSIIDLNKIKARYPTEQERDWFMKEYPTVMKGLFGVGITTDASEKPELLFKDKFSIQGYDIDGHDDATLGTSSGKAVGTSASGMGRKYFDEHGWISIYMCVRFPTVMRHEMHPLENVDMSEPTYKQLIGDPQIVAAEEPTSDDLDTWSTETGNIDIGVLPYGQWYRWQPSKVHFDYDTLQGVPFIKSGQITNHQQAVYVQSGEYNDVFQSQRLGNARTQSAIKATVHRKFPGVKSSIFAGA